jgi:hypothetical protein
MTTKDDGTREWKINGMLHRTDGPAVEYSSGSSEWWLNGERHRLDGPALLYLVRSPQWNYWKRLHGKSTYLSDEVRWYQNGQLHRSDGPAIERLDGSKFWYESGLLHCLSGPAIVRVDGTREWWKNGICHRENEPAIMYENGAYEWYFNGKQHRVGGPAVVSSSGARLFYVRGRLHRDDDGAAIQLIDGTKKWYKNNKLHRINGPAIENLSVSSQIPPLPNTGLRPDRPFTREFHIVNWILNIKQRREQYSHWSYQFVPTSSEISIHLFGIQFLFMPDELSFLYNLTRNRFKTLKLVIKKCCHCLNNDHSGGILSVFLIERVMEYYFWESRQARQKLLLK